MLTGRVALQSVPGEAPVSSSADDEPPPDAGWSRLPASALRVWHLDNLLGLLAASAVLGTVAVLGRPEFARPWLLHAAALVVLAAAVESFAVLPRRHARYRYRIAERSIVVESGALVVRQLIVPLHQVLYVEMSQGPVLRAHGLSLVRLGTIADPKSVGPLTREDAETLRRAVETSRVLRPPEERR